MQSPVSCRKVLTLRWRTSSCLRDFFHFLTADYQCSNRRGSIANARTCSVSDGLRTLVTRWRGRLAGAVASVKTCLIDLEAWEPVIGWLIMSTSMSPQSYQEPSTSSAVPMAKRRRFVFY